MCTFEFSLTGSGPHRFVLLNGFRMPMSSWDKVVPELEQMGQVLRYNRAGVGRSPKADAVQDGETVIRDLRALLDTSGLQPPYVLIGHSLGGLFAQQFARMYPDDIEALVLVDAAHPEEIPVQREQRPPRWLDSINRALKFVEKRFDPYRYSEDEEVLTTLEQISCAGDFPEIPVAAVSGLEKMPFVPAAAFEQHLAFQRRFTSLSPKFAHIWARKSGHFPQITEPDTVLEAVRSAVSGVLSEKPSEQHE